MADAAGDLSDSCNFLYRAMVERDPKKRRVKPVDRHMLQLDFADLDDSSDDSDYKVTDLEDEDSDSNDSRMNSDGDDNNDSSDDDDDDTEEDKNEDSTEDSKSDGSINLKKQGLTVAELIEQARIKQAQARQRIASTDLKSSQLRILVCAVCLGDISEEEDEIVECDGCGISVHEGCYGISDTESVNSTISSSSTEPWFCEACRSGNQNPVCELCPNSGGIFKETDVGKWVHIVCALYIPGVAFGNVDKLSPVTLFEMPYSKWGAKACVLCEDENYSRTGVCICCDAGMCRNYFHATCAQKEGLLSEASPEEVREIADPFFAYCKLHADKTIARSKRRNWLALQSQLKQRKENSFSNSEEQNRINRKLQRHRIKYLEGKAANPQPWVPTQKMPRMLTSSPSACRKLIRKAELTGIDTRTLQVQPLESIVDIRKRWHIAPAFNIEFVSYFLDRNERMLNMQSHLDQLLTENSQLQEIESGMRKKYEELLLENENLKCISNDLREQGTKLWKILNAISGKKRALPDILLIKAVKSPSKTGKKIDHDNSVALNKQSIIFRCGICKKTNDQHLLAKCDTCQLYYHLGCLDPPLTRMPKKTKLQGWQCSECDKTDDEEKDDDVDPDAPRQLREHIKEPAKFRVSVSCDNDLSKSNDSVKDGSIKTTTANNTKRKIVKFRRRSMQKKRARPVVTVTPKKHLKHQQPKVVILTKKKMEKEQVEADRTKDIGEPPFKKSRRSSSITKTVKLNDLKMECCRCKRVDSSNVVSCDNCKKFFHFTCLDPPVKKSPKQRGYDWHCEDCDQTDEEVSELPDNKLDKALTKRQKVEQKPPSPIAPRRGRKKSKD